jgi:transposase
VYIDETGIEHHISKEWAWVKRGQEIPLSVSGKRKKRINIVAGLRNGKLIAPFEFEGTCDAPLFEAYVEHILLPELEKGSILIMDNASFHKSSILTEIIEQHDCYLLFLPSYSPDLNPIEQAWATLKQKIKKARRDINDIFKAISFAFNDVST